MEQELINKNWSKVLYNDNKFLVTLEEIYHLHTFDRKFRDKIELAFCSFLELKTKEFIENYKEKDLFRLYKDIHVFQQKYIKEIIKDSETGSIIKVDHIKDSFFKDFGFEFFQFLNPKFYKTKQNKLNNSLINLTLFMSFYLFVRIEKKMTQTEVLSYFYRAFNIDKISPNLYFTYRRDNVLNKELLSHKDEIYSILASLSKEEKYNILYKALEKTTEKFRDTPRYNRSTFEFHNDIITTELLNEFLDINLIKLDVITNKSVYTFEKN